MGELHLGSWKEFVDYVHEKIVSQPDFVWRGQRSVHWALESGLERFFRGREVSSASEAGEVLRFRHLERFKLASRGRLDPRDLEERFLELAMEAEGDVDERDRLPVGPGRKEREENNWWAVGQHYGLSTPLLDWSTSPFVAAFFAFEQSAPPEERPIRRAVYGLHRRLVSQKSDEIREEFDGPERPPVLEFIEPLFKDNPRLVSQGGLFTRAPDGVDVREWVERSYKDGEDEGVWLLVVTLPNENRDYIMKALNRMNINHQSLFPDLYGATSFVNTQLVIEDY